MARIMHTSTNEYIPDSLYETVREQFEEKQSVYVSESGMSYEYDFSFDSYIDQFSFSDMVEYLLKH